MRVYELAKEIDVESKELMARAKELGAHMIFNVRLETSSISKGARRSVGSIEVLAYGTAIIP